MITLLTEWLYIAAQMPHGTHAQQNVFRAAQRAGRFAQALGAAGPRRRAAGGEAARPRRGEPADRAAAQRGALRRRRPRRGRAPGAASSPRRGRLAARRSTRQPTVISPQRPLRARARGLRPGRPQPRLGRRGRAGSSSPTPTSRSPTSAAPARPRTRYWNTGSWIYEPDLGSRQAYARYLRYAWPGTAIADRRRRARAAPAGAARRPQPRSPAGPGPVARDPDEAIPDELVARGSGDTRAGCAFLAGSSGLDPG